MNPDLQSLPLRDIHLPEPVSWWPLAPGWWILLGLIVLTVVTAYLYIYFKRRGELSRQAMAELTNIVNHYQQHRDPARMVSAISALLRRVTVTLYPQHNVAGLTGEQWLRFLDDIAPKKNSGEAARFNSELGQYLITLPYCAKPRVDQQRVKELVLLCRSWLQQVCKKSLPESTDINPPVMAGDR